MPLALGGIAVLIVAATLIGRRRALRPAPSVGSQGGSTGAGFHGTGVAASTDRRVAVHPAVKNAKRATTLIHTSSPTAPPKADAVTLVEMRLR